MVNVVKQQRKQQIETIFDDTIINGMHINNTYSSCLMKQLFQLVFSFTEKYIKTWQHSA